MDLGQVSTDVVAATARRASILWTISTPCVRSRADPAFRGTPNFENVLELPASASFEIRAAPVRGVLLGVRVPHHSAAQAFHAACLSRAGYAPRLDHSTFVESRLRTLEATATRTPMPKSGYGMDQWAAELLALCPKTSTSHVLQPEA